MSRGARRNCRPHFTHYTHNPCRYFSITIPLRSRSADSAKRKEEEEQKASVSDWLYESCVYSNNNIDALYVLVCIMCVSGVYTTWFL